MDMNQNLRLHEWIEMGKQAGRIREIRTIVLAYCMDEGAVLPLIADVVNGRITEERALDFLEHLIDHGTVASGESLPLS